MEEKADLLAMGTATGTVLIYSTAKGALHCTLVSSRDSSICHVCIREIGNYSTGTLINVNSILTIQTLVVG